MLILFVWRASLCHAGPAYSSRFRCGSPSRQRRLLPAQLATCKSGRKRVAPDLPETLLLWRSVRDYAINLRSRLTKPLAPAPILKNHGNNNIADVIAQSSPLLKDIAPSGHANQEICLYEQSMRRAGFIAPAQGQESAPATGFCARE